MKLDKMKFATLIGFISCRYALTITHEDMREMDYIIDIDVEPVSSGQIDPVALDRMIGLMQRGDQKIEAIKQYRNLTGAGLKEAKEAVERYWPAWPNGVIEQPKDATLGDILGRATGNKD